MINGDPSRSQQENPTHATGRNSHQVAVVRVLDYIVTIPIIEEVRVGIV